MEVDRIIKTIQNDDEQNDDRLGDNFCIFFIQQFFFSSTEKLSNGLLKHIFWLLVSLKKYTFLIK